MRMAAPVWSVETFLTKTQSTGKHYLIKEIVQLQNLHLEQSVVWIIQLLIFKYWDVGNEFSNISDTIKWKSLQQRIVVQYGNLSNKRNNIRNDLIKQFARIKSNMPNNMNQERKCLVYVVTMQQQQHTHPAIMCSSTVCI